MNDCPNGEMRDLLPDLLSNRLDAARRGCTITMRCAPSRSFWND